MVLMCSSFEVVKNSLHAELWFLNIGLAKGGLDVFFLYVWVFIKNKSVSRHKSLDIWLKT
jgi:hypothetical protein